MDRGACWAAVHGVPKSWTLRDSTAAGRSSEERLVRGGRAEPPQGGCVARRTECGLGGGVAAASSAWNCTAGRRRESVVLID